jgi:hypothetical protein
VGARHAARAQERVHAARERLALGPGAVEVVDAEDERAQTVAPGESGGDERGERRLAAALAAVQADQAGPRARPRGSRRDPRGEEHGVGGELDAPGGGQVHRRTVAGAVQREGVGGRSLRARHDVPRGPALRGAERRLEVPGRPAHDLVRPRGTARTELAPGRGVTGFDPERTRHGPRRPA